MNNTYADYRKTVEKMLNGNHQDYMICVNDGLVIETDYSMTGEPYRCLTEEEWNDKFKPKN